MKDTVVGHTDESGVQLPPLHPRCRCAIMYREVGSFKFDVQRFAGTNIQFRRFVVDKEARDYFESASKIWLEQLTAYEKSAVTQYTGKAYEKINSYLRGELVNIELKPVLLTELENKINAIESALSKFELQDNIILYRQCGEEFLQTLRTSKFGLFHENGFWSTAAVEGSVNRGSVHIEIFFSAGTGAGAWIKPLSLNPNENEFLINCGAYFKILDFKKEGAYTFLKLSYIGRNAGGLTKMRAHKIETVKDLDEWLDSGEYKFGERFECKNGELRPVETKEEFDAVVEQCIKERLWGLSPDGIRELFANNVVEINGVK